MFYLNPPSKNGIKKCKTEQKVRSENKIYSRKVCGIEHRTEPHPRNL